MKIKTAELTGAALDWVVAKIELPPELAEVDEFMALWDEPSFHYSTDWSQGGPIIERECLAIIPVDDSDLLDQWYALDPLVGRKKKHYGPTPLVAAMRCFVASKLGDEADVPEELLK